jgi:hypothetical protein
MDPLSVTTGILAFLGAISVTIKTAKGFHDAPNAASALLNEIADARLVVFNIESLLKDSDTRFTLEVRLCHNVL